MAYPSDTEEQEKDVAWRRQRHVPATMAEEAEAAIYKERRRLGQISGTVPFLEGYIRGDDPRLVGPAAIPADKSLIRSTETRPPAQHPLSKAPVSFEKIGQLNRDLGKVKNRLALKLKQTRKGSPEWASLEKQYRDAENSADDMFRLARALGRRRAGSSATDVEKQVAGRVIEGHEQTGTVASRDEIAQMKAEIEQGLLAGNETQRKTLETRVGKKGVKRLASLRTKAIEADARANAAAIEKTGKPLTDEARANPRASGLPSYVVIAMETARQKTEKFDSELANAATLSFQRLAAGHRSLKGRRGKVTSLTPRVPPKGEQLTSVEQLIQQPGEGRARLPGRGRGRGVGRRKPSGNEQVMFDWLAKKHPYIFRDIRGSTKRAGAVRFNIAMDRVDWTPAQLKKWYEGEQKGATPEQAADARMIHRTLFKQYDRTIEVSQGLQKGHYVKHTQKMELAHQEWLYKLDVLARTATTQEGKDWAAFEQAMYLERYKLGLAKPGKFVTKQVPDILGDIIELESTTTSIAAPPPGEMPKRYQVSQEDILDPKRGAQPTGEPPTGPGFAPLAPPAAGKGAGPISDAQKLYNQLNAMKPQTIAAEGMSRVENKKEYADRTQKTLRRLGQLDAPLFRKMKAILLERRKKLQAPAEK